MQKRPKMLPKTLPKRRPNPSEIDAENKLFFGIDFSGFGLDFGGFSHSNLEASWPLCPLKTDPGGHFDAVGFKNRRKLHLGPPKTRF